MIRVCFLLPGGARREVTAQTGATLLQVAWDNDIGIEGACEGALACTTCHVVVEPAQFDRLAEIGPEEDDLLDLAAGVAPTSRLGCQIVLNEAMDGLIVTVPPDVGDIRL